MDFKLAQYALGWPVLQKVSKSFAPQVLSDVVLRPDLESGFKNANFENFATAQCV